METFLDGRIALHADDCRTALKAIPDASIDAVVTDPPYALVSIVKRFGSANAAPAKYGTDGAYARASAGFMGQKWDTGDTAFDPGFWSDVLRVIKPGAHLLAMGSPKTYHRLACAIEDAGFEIRDCIMWVYSTGMPKSHDAGNGWGTATKPSHEPIALARKPLSEGTIAANIRAHGTGAINIEATRVNGKWPANLIHDNSAEVLALSSDAARFFHSVKADFDDRLGSRHPTIKPVDLMQYFCRLITPPGGCVLDPFAGTGTTGEAAWREGFNAILIEREAEYQNDIRRRMALCLAGPDERVRESIKARGQLLEPDSLPLFTPR
jgi:site-specific DNA-methyltransferase (adenine-specific)